jgi:hypothetical protein
MKEKYPDLPDAEIWDKIAIIDTENGSGELYVGSEIANTKIGVYNAVTLEAPFKVERYIEALELCEQGEKEVCIIDSTTHAWSGEGGLLEQQNNAAKRGGNSYTAWRDITPLHNRFVEKMLQTPMHIIATMRSKQEYVQDKDDSGKTRVRKLGLEPEQRKGMEYEFTTFFEIDAEHNAFGSKDRSSIFDQETFKITPETGRKMMKWLNGGTAEKHVVVATSIHKATKEEALAKLKTEVVDLCKSIGGASDARTPLYPTLLETVKKYASNGNPNSITDETKLSELKSELVLLQNQETKSE